MMTRSVVAGLAVAGGVVVVVEKKWLVFLILEGE